MNPITADPRTALLLADQHQAAIRATYPRPSRRDPRGGLLARLRSATGPRRTRTLRAGEPALQAR